METIPCTKCSLYKVSSANNVKFQCLRESSVEMAFITEAPGDLYGTAGDNYEEALRLAGIQRSNILTGYTYRCVIQGNRKVKASEIKVCFPSLRTELIRLKPKVIVTMGAIASKYILNDPALKLGQSHGRVFSGNDLFGYECLIIPTWHPSPRTFKSAPKRKSQMHNDIKAAKGLLDRDLNTKKDWKSLGVFNLKTWELVKPTFFNADVITIDIETAGEKTGLDIYDPKAHITNIGLTTSSNYSISIVCDEAIDDELADSDFDGFTYSELSKVIADIKILLETKKICGHGMKFDLQYIEKQWGIKTNTWWWDTSIGHSIVQPGDSNRLKDISWYYTNMGGYEYELAGGVEGGLESTTGRERVQYNNDDVVCTHRCMEKQIKILDADNKLELARDIVMPASHVFSEMEYHGVKINFETLKNLDKQYVEKLTLSKNNLHLHGTVMAFIKKYGTFNPNSPKQVSEILFNKNFCGFDVLERTETKQPSTGKRTLQKLKIIENSELCGLLLDYKKLSKLYSTNIKGMYKNIINGRVHTNYYLDIAVTGRTTSREPNLQNIPKDSDIKSMFEADDGHLLIDLDYKQMELVVSTYYTGDQVMVSAIESGDAHTYLAKRIFGMENVSEDKRRFIKTLNFGVFYGMGVAKLADALEVSQDDAANLRNEYFRLLPDTQRWIMQQRKRAELYGYANSLFNRKRYYKIKGDLKKDDKEDYNSAVNHPIQSCASDLMLYGMVQWRRYLEKEDINQKDAYMVLQVHDSIATTVREDIVPKVLLAKKKIFESTRFDWMTLPLTVDIEVGKNWGNTKKIEF
jgi:uracil-DNA glycosylase family 4